ncbi:hypothetical protein [Clostridium autoethanogenum]|uniref:SipL SPOCS domain-containing protein n=1 Tax=Clostridium autoethanogenum DSM 10061 TaxID=1341692 RepID=A0ABN4BN51_9CLOT|nr:hypothetical protein [Clostridium autoethanogenum]AGY78223.1 hypothetical protein CAETHG_4022 [Clostridium autoethanogenum DSM 10061]ALU38355.1 Hypothetical protein CLAU_3928 [Clostridium autoethanogenum DSM 10061]OVY51118.1 hypothetical protein WX72_02280 [Clostridium autoethanogenum]
MGHCEVIKAKVIFADEIFNFEDMRTVDTGIDLTNATFDTNNARIKICVLECGDFECVEDPCGTKKHKLKGKITFAICEDFKINVGCKQKPMEHFFRVTKEFTFNKPFCEDLKNIDPNCPGLRIDKDSLECQIEKISGTNIIEIKDKTKFTQNLKIEVKIIAEIERLLCVSLCQNIGNIRLVRDC